MQSKSKICNKQYHLMFKDIFSFKIILCLKIFGGLQIFLGHFANKDILDVETQIINKRKKIEIVKFSFFYFPPPPNFQKYFQKIWLLTKDGTLRVLQTTNFSLLIAR